MKKFLTFSISILLGFNLVFLFPIPALASKAKNNLNNTKGIKSDSIEDTNAKELVQVINRDGKNNVDGSVLNPNEDEVLISLQQLLSVLKKGDLSKLSIVLSSVVDSTKTFTVPREALSIQKRKVGKKFNKYLVLSLYNLTTPSGVIVSPSALPSDKYKLRLTGKKSDIATDTFDYRTPILLVGNVKDSNGKGIVSVESIEGDLLSDKTVAINPNGTFITEVKAGKVLELQAKAKLRKLEHKNYNKKNIKTQASEDIVSTEDESTPDTTTENNLTDKDYVGLVHAVTDTDLYAIAPLNNTVETNAFVAEKPIEVSKTSTLTATIAKENAKEGLEDLAVEVADQKLKDLQSNEEILVEGINCDINQFSNLCTGTDDEIYFSVGKEFKNFVGNSECNFREFNLIKKFLSLAPEEANTFIGRGYCEFIGGESDGDKPCKIYSEILANYKSGKSDLTQLPCPPRFCNEFANIKPPVCVESVGEFCEESKSILPTTTIASSQVCRGPKCAVANVLSCVHRPVKDKHCAEIGVDISEEECKNEEFNFAGQSSTWTITTDSNGYQFCVYSQAVSPSVNIADECDLFRCHNKCAQKFGFTSPIIGPIAPGSELAKASEELHNCHIDCEKEAGRFTDCSDGESEFFSGLCCGNRINNYVYQIKTGSVGNPGSTSSFSGPGKSPVPVTDVRYCLCSNPNNFNNDERQFVKEDAISACLDRCPEGFEIDLLNKICLPICREDEVRNPVGGSCRKKCPQGFIQDDSGNCKCPEGQSIGRSGKCESSPTCPQYCYNYPLRELLASHDFTGSTSSTYSPPYSGGSGYTPPSTGPGYIPPGSTGSTNTLPPECQKCFGGGGPTSCGPDQYSDSTGVCRCNLDGSVATSLGPDGCKKQILCGSSNMYPNPNANQPNQPPCICPSGLPYWDNNQGYCVAQCPIGTKPNNSGIYFSNAPIPCEKTQTECPLTTPIKCADGRCAVTQLECNSSCPPATPIKCSDGSCVANSTDCTSSCPPATPIRCSDGTCAVSAVSCPTTCPPATPIKCSDGSCAVSAASCSSSCPTTTPIKCSDGTCATTAISCPCPSATPYKCSDGTCAVSCPTTCPSATPYKCSDGTCAASAANCSSTVICPAPYIKDPANSSYCTCPSSTPIAHYSSCLTTCPTGLVATTQPGTMKCPTCSSYQICLCPNGSYPSANGTCGSTTSTPSTPSALTATVSSLYNVTLSWVDNSNNETYFSIYRRISGGTTWTLVTSGIGSNVTSYTETLSGGTYEYHVNACNSFGCSVDSNIISVIVAASTSCPSGQISTASGCKTICDSGWNTVTSNCACGTGATQTSTNYCSCPTGQIYSQPGCGLGQVTLDSVVINGSNVVVSYSKNFVTCAHLQTSSFVKLHTQNHFCSNSGPITVPLSSFNSTFQNGLQVKLCHGNNSNICSQLVTVTTSSPTPTPTPSPTPQPITLNSAVINNGNTISLNYSQVSNEGTKLKTIDNINLHAYNFSFGVFSSGTEFPLPWFYSNLMAGTQIKLCHVLNSSVCSQPVTVTESSIRTCNAGETSSLTSVNPCKCTLYGSPNQYSNYTCSCGNGRTYSSTTGCGTHICASGEVFNFNDQCACATGAKFDQLTNKCICLSGQTYIASGCISSVPNTPTALTTSYNLSNPGVVNLTWTDNSTNEDSFKIYRRPLGSNTWDTTISINTSNVTSYTDTVFTSGTYEYRVNACNANGCSVDSVIVPVTVTFRITLSSATVSSGIITYNFIKDSSDCLNLYTSGGTLINTPGYCHGGASGAGYPLSTLNNNLQPGISVKLCYNLDPIVCSNLVTLGGSFTTHTCAPNEAYSSTNICNCASGASPNLQNICACSGSNIYTTTGCQAPQVTLYSVVINQTDSTVSVNYSKNFNDCATLKYSNSNTAAHSGDLFCTNTGNVNIPLSTFDQTKFQNSVNVKLCNSTGTCSSTTQVSGPNICVPGGSPSSGTCSCFSPAGPDQNDTYKRCACPLGSIYTNSNGASFCRRYCNVGEVNYGLPNDQCSCGVYGAANSTGCSCSNGNTYNSQTACGADRHI